MKVEDLGNKVEDIKPKVQVSGGLVGCVFWTAGSMVYAA